MHKKEDLTNNVLLIDRTGTIVLNYGKTYICNFKGGTETTLTAGTEYPIATLSYAQGTVRIGALICFDREFPEAARAFENKTAVAIANYSAPNCDGTSAVCNYKGAVIAKAKKEATLLIASLDLTTLRRWQKNEPWGPTYCTSVKRP